MRSVAEERVRHLEMIQSVITRMATNSFILKGWAITLVSGVFVLATKESSTLYFLIAYIPLITFWFLDSYYLQLERKYRVLYNAVGKCETPDSTFSLHVPGSCSAERTDFIQSMFSTTELGFYGSMSLLVAIVLIIRVSI